MLLLDSLAERQIEEHISRSNCSQNAYAGRALDLSVDAQVPTQVRALYRVLKNNGYVPAEVSQRNEIQSLRQLLRFVSCEHQRALAVKRLLGLNTVLELRGRAIAAGPAGEYRHQLLAHRGDATAQGHR